jgi:hypothetical protein
VRLPVVHIHGSANTNAHSHTDAGAHNLHKRAHELDSTDATPTPAPDHGGADACTNGCTHGDTERGTD